MRDDMSVSAKTSKSPVPGMGAIALEKGFAFRVWAPNAGAVSVIGDFNGFDETKDPLVRDDAGNWYGEVPEAATGQSYRFHLVNGTRMFSKIDPRAREVTNSVGNGVLRPQSPAPDDGFRIAPWNALVIYELHIGTFARDDKERVGTFDDAVKRLPYLKSLGVNAVEVMPAAEFSGDLSWGYNPAHPFAVESAYGGPEGFRRFIAAAHAAGIAVILDVVYNHFGPADLDLWQFDGWSENGKGGIYFYNDDRSRTPWGDTRPDYGRGEVRAYLRDNAHMWLEEYGVDGLRYDMTLYMRTVSGTGDDIPDGWSVAQWINREVRENFPGRITIAEDLRNNASITAHENEGGANFGSQWDDRFVHPIRAALIASDDAHRDMHAVAAALNHRYGGDAFARVVYTESHDEVANGKARVVSEVNPGDPAGWHALKRSALGAGLVLTAPGIPMVFQGQAMLEDGWFSDTDPIDWSKTRKFSGVKRLYQDLIRLRLNRDGVSRGLIGQHILVHHVNNDDKVVAYLRWNEAGPNDTVLVVANFSAETREGYCVGLPHAGRWVARFNSDWSGYREDLADFPVFDLVADDVAWDGQPARAILAIAPYSVNIYTMA